MYEYVGKYEVFLMTAILWEICVGDSCLKLYRKV